MVDREPGLVSGRRRSRRSRFGCALLVLAVLVLVGALVWIDQRQIRDPQPGEAAPADGTADGLLVPPPG